MTGVERAGTGRRVSLAGLASATGWVMLALAASSALGQRWWPLSLLVHFWPQLIVILLLTGFASALMGARKSPAAHVVGAAILLATIGLNGGGGASGGDDDVLPAASPGLGALFANVGRWNVDHGRLVELIRRTQPDVVGLAEVDDTWLQSLAALDDVYPHRVAAARDDHFGTALLSRLPIASWSVEPIGRLGLPSIVATLETSEGGWKILVTHPVPPFHAAAFTSRNSQIAGLAAHVSHGSTPTVVLGDLNATAWSPYVRDLREEAGLSSAASGLRAFYTWPTGFPVFGLALDHCLYSAGAVAVRYRVLEAIGSDHFPILCELERGERI